MAAWPGGIRSRPRSAACCAADPAGLCIRASNGTKPARRTRRLAWLDVATGQSTSHPLEKIDLPRKGYRPFSLGPIFTVGPRLLAAYRDNTQGRKLQGLLELLPVVELTAR